MSYQSSYQSKGVYSPMSYQSSYPSSYPSYYSYSYPSPAPSPYPYSSYGNSHPAGYPGQLGQSNCISLTAAGTTTRNRSETFEIKGKGKKKCLQYFGLGNGLDRIKQSNLHEPAGSWSFCHSPINPWRMKRKNEYVQIYSHKMKSKHTNEIAINSFIN